MDDHELIEKEEAPKSKKLPVWAVAGAFVILLGFLGILAWGLRNAQEGPISIGQKVPSFELLTFDGEMLDTADYAGTGPDMTRPDAPRQDSTRQDKTDKKE